MSHHNLQAVEVIKGHCDFLKMYLTNNKFGSMCLLDQALCGGLYPGPGRDLWNVQIAGVLLAPFSSGGF